MARTYTEHIEYAVRRDLVVGEDGVEAAPQFITETFHGDTILTAGQAEDVLREMDKWGRDDCYHTIVQRHVLVSEWKMP